MELDEAKVKVKVELEEAQHQVCTHHTCALRLICIHLRSSEPRLAEHVQCFVSISWSAVRKHVSTVARGSLWPTRAEALESCSNLLALTGCMH